MRRVRSYGAGTEAELASRVEDLDGRLKELDLVARQRHWEQYTRGADVDLNEIDEQRFALFRDPAVAGLLESWRGRPRDLQLARAVELAYRRTVSARVDGRPEIFQLQNAISTHVLRYRPAVDGRSLETSDVTQILRTDPDRALRRAVWEARGSLSKEVGSETRELVKKRNAAARALGYRTYVDLVLRHECLSRERVASIVTELEKETAPPFREALDVGKKGLRIDRVRPWDVDFLIHRAVGLDDCLFPRERIVPAVLDEIGRIGFDPDALGIEVVYRNIPFGGLCVPMDPPGDVRILVNPRDGWPHYMTLFHEYGHALHAANVDVRYHLLHYEPGCFAEGMAQVLGQITYRPQWLRSFVGESGAREAARGLIRSWILRLRYLMLEVAFEFAAYERPDEDMDALYGACEERYLMTTRETTPRWAATPFLSAFPVYRHNYVLADVIASQTHAFLKGSFGPAFRDRRVGEFLRNGYWAPGAGVEWEDKLRRATGSGLSMGPLLADLGLGR